MSRLSLFPCLVPLAITAMAGCAHAQTSRPAPLYEAAQLPAFRGALQLFTLTPRGDVDGFVLTDGTEVKTPPHLTDAIVAAVKPGDSVTIHGLKAASLPLIQAMSVRNDATGAEVIDVGPPAGQAPAARPPGQDEATPVAVHGRLRMLLHGPRGDVNGALLEDGTVLKLPPPEAARFAGVLTIGKAVAAEGIRRTTPAGALVNLTALGSEGGPLRPVAGGPRLDLTTAKPGSG